MINPDWHIARTTASHRLLALTAMVFLAALALMPLWGDRAMLRLATEIAAYVVLATMWNLLAGFAGVMSIGQQAFVGIGGYTIFTLAGLAGIHPALAIPLSGLLALMIAVPTGALLFRLSGAYFAIGSWVMAEIFMLLVSQFEILGGGSGMSLPVSAAKALGASADDRANMLWWTALAIALLAVTISYLWLRSPRGLALMAMRDNEVAASTLGVDTLKSKMLVYLVAAFITGLAGAVLFLMKLRISPPAAFDVGEWTANIIFIVVIGGIGFLEGPLIGAAIFFLLRGMLSHLGAWYLMLLGLIAIVVMLKAPGGLWGFLHDRFGWELFPVGRKLIRSKPPTAIVAPQKAPADRVVTNAERPFQRHSSLGLSPKETPK